jgi:hypothetical protein
MIIVNESRIAQNKLRLEEYRMRKEKEILQNELEFGTAKDSAVSIDNDNSNGNILPGGNNRREVRDNPGVASLCD